MPTQYWKKEISKIQAKNSSVLSCPDDKPYYDGQKCIMCSE